MDLSTGSLILKELTNKVDLQLYAYKLI